MKFERLCLIFICFLLTAFHLPAMDDDDDILLEMLSYTCPVSGMKRIAGQVDDSQHQSKQLAHSCNGYV